MRTYKVGSLSLRRIRRAVRHAWLVLVAPKWARQKWNAADGRKIRVCDMRDAHVLNALHYCRRWYLHYQIGTFRRERYELILREAKRRRLPTERRPKWLDIQNRQFPERQQARAEALRELERLAASRY